jgi:hypothetical protein
MSIVAGLDIRRRKRTGQPTGFVLGVLLAAVGVSLAAQVAEAERSVWGWTVAALPAFGLLAVVKIVLSRTGTPADRDSSLASVRPGPPEPGWGRRSDRRSTPPSSQPGPDRRPAGPAVERASCLQVGRRDHQQTGSAEGRGGTGKCPSTDTSGPVRPDRLDDVLLLGWTVADDLRRQQRPLTRASLIQGIRATGHTIGTDKASALLRQLKAAT